MKMQKIKVGILGGAGYTGGELLRILLNHPAVDISYIHSNSNANKKVYQVHRDLIGDTELEFTDTFSQDIDVLFLCMGHGDSKVFLESSQIKQSIKIIDLSQDYRLKKKENPFVYGLPELNKEQIKQSSYIANPGCFATAIQLALLPLAGQNKLPKQICLTALTGSTGAGQKPSATTHFSYRSNNISVYKAFEHQHLGEIGQSLAQLQDNYENTIQFIPQRGDFARGIFVSVVLKSNDSLEDLQAVYKTFYQDAPFTFLSEDPIDLKQVVNTNKCLISIEKSEDNILITCAIDNLLKGASGQAVQNMNLMFGLPEDWGLKLKASAF